MSHLDLLNINNSLYVLRYLKSIETLLHSPHLIEYSNGIMIVVIYYQIQSLLFLVKQNLIQLDEQYSIQHI